LLVSIYTTPMTLTHERLRELLHYEPETGVLTWRVRRSNCAVGARAGRKNKHGRQVRIDGTLYRTSRIAFFCVSGVWPTSLIDHEDRDNGNDAWRNLREATNKQNGENRTAPTNNTSGHKGVFLPAGRRKWQAEITHWGRRIRLGSFATKDLAIECRELAEAMLFTHAPAN
jgi:hypothetical protein